MQQERGMNEHESLLIIQQMIDTAKQEQKDDGKGWIVWGWMLFSASILTVFNLKFNWFQTFFFWNIFGLITFAALVYETIVSLVKARRQRVRTYTREIFEKLNKGFFISLMFIIVTMNIGVSPMKGFPLLMSLYAFWILIYASVLDFKPSMIGAYTMWALAFAALFVTTFEEVMLLHAAGVLAGYIIPGHIANKKFKQVAERKSSNQVSGV